MADWYYVDSKGQQVGPMPVESLREALRRGAATQASLAWRDGLSGWLPISQLTEELGPFAVPAPALPPARTPATDANPYRAPESQPGEGYFGDGAEVVYAGFWRRWAALFIDQLIIAVPLGIVVFGIAFAIGLGTHPDPNPFAVLSLQLVFYVVYFGVAVCYYAGLESSEAQATFGKRALGIKVTDLSGQRLSFKHAAGRWAAAAISYMAMYIGFLMAGLTQRKQALHDMVAGTLVVDRWAYTRFPERQQRGLGGCLIVFIVVVFGSFIIIPILAAIAISQYADYVRRAGGSAYVEPEARTVYFEPVSSTYVARCLPPSFEA